jgi:transcriptional regulator with XRE-family HTH domain
LFSAEERYTVFFRRRQGDAVISRLGRKVRYLREQAGLSQSELAMAIGLSESSKGFISEIESGKKLPKAELVLKLADQFGVSTDYLLRDDQGVELDETL